MTDSPLTRASLVLRLRDRTDDAAWTQFLEIYAPMVYRFSVSRGLQDADATDLVQEVSRRVGDSIDRLDYKKEKGGFRAWLFTITRNCLSNFFVKKQRGELIGAQSNGTEQVKMLNQIPEAFDGLDTIWEREYQLQLFAKAMETIRPIVEPNTWAAFELTAIQNQSPDAAAAEIGMSRGAVYVAKSRVTAKLRTEVERMMEEDQ